MRPAVRHTPFLPQYPSQQRLGSPKHIPQPLERPRSGALLLSRGTRPPARVPRGICQAIASRSHILQPGSGRRSTRRYDWLPKKPQDCVRGARDRNKNGHQHGCVEEQPHRSFLWFADSCLNFGWPSADRSRSRRMSRSTLFVAAAEIGSSKSRTQMPCFFRIPTRPLTGRRTICSPEISSSRESPAESCNSSRTGLGRTTRPALSTVSVVVMMVFYHGIYHFEWHSVARRRQEARR